jgi:hypothetical protein
LPLHFPSPYFYPENVYTESATPSLDPARNDDWQATLLVRLGTRVLDEDQIVRIVAEKMKGHAEYKFIESLLRDYWPEFDRLSEDARAAFKSATRVLFDPATLEYGQAISSPSARWSRIDSGYFRRD